MYILFIRIDNNINVIYDLSWWKNDKEILSILDDFKESTEPFVYTGNSTCPQMCTPHDGDICNGTVFPVYINYEDGKLDYKRTDLHLECPNSTYPEPEIDTIAKAQYID